MCYTFQLIPVMSILLCSIGLFFPPSASSQPLNHFFGLPGFDRSNAIVPDGSRGYYLGGASEVQGATQGWIAHCRAHHACRKLITLSNQPFAFTNVVVFDLLRLANDDLVAVGWGLPTRQAELPEGEQKDDGWAIRLTPEGRLIWSRSYPSTSHERFYFVTALADGNLLVGGRSEAKKMTGRSHGVSYILDPETGQALHRKEWGEPIHRAGFYDGLAIPHGGYVLVGWATRPETETDDVWVVSVTPNHAERWSTMWGDTGDDLGYHAVMEANGNVTVFGWGTRRESQYTSGLVLRLMPDGTVSGYTFVDVGEVGNDKFQFGIPVPGGGYVASGEASVSPKEYRGRAWVVSLDRELKKVDEKHLDIRGSRLLGMLALSDNRVVVTGYGIAPGSRHVDAWLTEVQLNRKKDLALSSVSRSADEASTHLKSAVVREILSKDFAELVKAEFQALDPDKTPEPRPGFGVQISGDFDAMMRGAPVLNPEAPGFHEGNAAFFHEALGKAAVVGLQLTSKEFQKALTEVLSFKGTSADFQGIKEAITRLEKVKTKNRHDVFEKKFFAAYLDGNYELGLVMGDLEKLQARGKSGVLPTIKELATALRSYADRVGALIYRPGIGPQDVAARKSTWKALDKLAQEAETEVK
jgi:hypothetical protein